MRGFFKSKLLSSGRLLRKLGHNLTNEDRERNRLLQDWAIRDNEFNFRTNYPQLNNKSIVFDLGGYQGQWASNIFSQYLSSLYVFEPHPKFFKKIQNRFELNNQIQVFEFGLGGSQSQIKLGSSEDSTSAFINSQEVVDAEIRSISDFLNQHQIARIDLMKINIEGGEYELLESMIMSNMLSMVENIQIQFHDFIPDARKRMSNIQNELSKTHRLTYQFDFFWENWELIPKYK